MPIIEKIRLLHSDIYIIGQKLSKQHKLGIHHNVEQSVRELMRLSIKARFKVSNNKLKVLEITRIENEVLKHIIRTEYELGIISQKEYIRLAEQMVEISKMLNGWIKYITEKATGISP